MLDIFKNGCVKTRQLCSKPVVSSVLAIAGLERNSLGPQHFTGLDALNGLELSRVVVSAKTFIHHQRPVGAGGAWGAK